MGKLIPLAAPARQAEASSIHSKPGTAAESVLEPPDQMLVQAIQRGDNRAAEGLYRRLYPTVARTLWRVLQSTTPDHDDLVQVTFERVIRTLVNGRFEGACSLTTWAASIATHVALDSLRARTRERRFFSGQEATEVETGDGNRLERSIEARSEVQRLQGMLSRMNEDQANAVILCEILGYSLSELAAAMGVTEAAAQSRLARGRKDLLRRSLAVVARRTS